MMFMLLMVIQGVLPLPSRGIPPSSPRAVVVTDTIPGSTPNISVVFVDTPLEEVLFSFADFSGRSIVFGPGVAGVVNAEVRDQPWPVALRTILDSHGFAWHEPAPGILRVDRPEDLFRARSWAATEVRAFPVQFAAAAAYETAVRELLSN
jgi:type II secretory pathway component GspD/PulD (secretin)